MEELARKNLEKIDKIKSLREKNKDIFEIKDDDEEEKKEKKLEEINLKMIINENLQKQRTNQITLNNELFKNKEILEVSNIKNVSNELSIINSTLSELKEELSKKDIKINWKRLIIQRNINFMLKNKQHDYEKMQLKEKIKFLEAQNRELIILNKQWKNIIIEKEMFLNKWNKKKEEEKKENKININKKRQRDLKNNKKNKKKNRNNNNWDIINLRNKNIFKIEKVEEVKIEKIDKSEILNDLIQQKNNKRDEYLIDLLKINNVDVNIIDNLKNKKILKQIGMLWKLELIKTINDYNLWILSDDKKRVNNMQIICNKIKWQNLKIKNDINIGFSKGLYMDQNNFDVILYNLKKKEFWIEIQSEIEKKKYSRKWRHGFSKKY